MKLLSFHAVPPPTLNITGPPQLVVYEGTNGALTCNILVTSTIDTEVNVSAQWVKDGEEVASSNRISISEVSRNELSNHEYQFSLSISPFNNSADPGLYTSKVTITPTENSNYISAAETSEAYLLSVAGIQPYLYIDYIISGAKMSQSHPLLHYPHSSGATTYISRS